MQLLTEADKALLKNYPLYSQDHKKADAIVLFKYFLPGTAATWYILEGQPEGEAEEYIFFGYVEGLAPGCDEYGYIALSELEELEISVPVIDGKTGKEIGALPCKIEKDLYLKEGTTIGELVPAVRKLWEDPKE